MHRSGSWFERDEGYRNALFEIHSAGHPDQETPVRSCMFCMPPGDTTGMPKRPHGFKALLALFLLDDEEDEADDTEDDRQGRTA